MDKLLDLQLKVAKVRFASLRGVLDVWVVGDPTQLLVRPLEQSAAVVVALTGCKGLGVVVTQSRVIADVVRGPPGGPPTIINALAEWSKWRVWRFANTCRLDEGTLLVLKACPPRDIVIVVAMDSLPDGEQTINVAGFVRHKDDEAQERWVLPVVEPEYGIEALMG